MRWLIVSGCLGVVLVIGLLILVLADDDLPTDGPVAVEAGPAVPAPPPADAHKRNRPKLRPADPVNKNPSRVARHKDPEDPVSADTVQRFGQEFEKKWYADREKLGEERHREMEKLWFEGRRPRGDPQSIAKLEKLLEEFPDTNRAGCAAMELGHHYIRDRNLPLAERREKARTYWHMVEERYSDTLCEYNAPAAGLSKLGLATWVYRSEDPGQARRLLEEIISDHKGETDHLGRPLEESARRLLKGL